MKKIIFLMTLLISFSVLSEEKKYGDVVVSKVESIYDGDTFTVTINKWPILIGEKIDIRVNGVDTPEMKGHCDFEKAKAIEAKAFTVAFLTTDKKIYLKNLGRDKYFRIDADVVVNGKSLADELIKAKLGKPYDGGTKESWCGVETSTKVAVQ